MTTDHFNRIQLCVLITLAAPAFGQEPFRCQWVTGEISIDGNESETAWQQAHVITNFFVPSTDGKKPTMATTAKLLWDRDFLYFFAELEDQDLFADITEHDGQTWNNDVFEIFFKPSDEKPGYYEFQVNAAGTEMDMFIPDRTQGGYSVFKSTEKFHWKTAVNRLGSLNERDDRDMKWTVEGRWPWTDFLPTGGRPEVNEVWKFALCRYDYTRDHPPELSSCAPLTKVDFHRVQDYASIRFVGPSEVDPRTRLLSTRKHYLDSKVTGSPEPRLPYRPVRAYPKMNLEWPIDVQVEPGSRRFIIIEEKGSYGPTLIKRSRDDATSSELEWITDPNGVAYSIAFHPKFKVNGYMYIGSNGKGEGDKRFSRVVRYQLDRSPPYQVVGAPLTIIEWESNGHNGAAITFGLDGMMYVTSGDGTSDSDTNVAGQDMSKLLSKVLRIDVDHPDANRPYSIPVDNPFVGLDNVRPETWAYGLRNPWRITTDSRSGHIWVGNNGQDMFEQAYLLQRSANYGWSVYEGSYPFYMQRMLGPTPHVKPTVEHPHSESRSLTGGVVYHGSRLPELQGAYVYGDYSTGKVWGVKHDGSKVVWHREIADTTFQLSAITLDLDGELILVDHRGDAKGGLYHLQPNLEQEDSTPFPTKLSQTGLFATVQDHSMAEGAIPYAVNAPFWSDGASKVRFLALPSDGRIGITDRWGWDLPESTVIVKSFGLEMREGDPTSHRWIETRLLTKQQGEWVGYSYAWNEDQTDADLVQKGGRDREFDIRSSNPSQPNRMQVWHYPSRAECMVCHTRAANYVLGISTPQMNRDFDYGAGLVLNQLEAIEAMGIVKSNWLVGAKKLPTDSQLPLRSDNLLRTSPSGYEKLSNPYLSTESIDKRARAFLHSNCAYCHVEAGGGNAKMDLSIYSKPDAMRIFGVPPTHHHFEKENARLIAPNRPEQSVLLHRVAIRAPGQMPPLGSSMADRESVAMLKEWILQLKNEQP
jgi:uncharacterized repeat protein (TIGR03806 family)